jgi:hypothetical protein
VYKFWNKFKNKINHGFAVSAVMFEIVEMYIFQIHLHYFFLVCCMLMQNRDLFYFWICSRIYTLVTSLFDSSRNRYFSQLTLTNRIYLFNSAEYLTASKRVACKQVQNFRPPWSFDFQLRLKINLRKQEKSFQRSTDVIRITRVSSFNQR